MSWTAGLDSDCWLNAVRDQSAARHELRLGDALLFVHPLCRYGLSARENRLEKSSVPLLGCSVTAVEQPSRAKKKIDPRCMLLEELPPEAGSQKVSQWKGKQDCNLAKAAADTVNVSGACQFLVCNDFHTFVRVALTKSSLKVFTTAPLVVFHGSLPFRVRRLFDSRRGSVRAPKKSYMKRRPLARPHRLVRVMSMPFLAQYHPINASAFSQHCITTGRVHVAQCKTAGRASTTPIKKPGVTAAVGSPSTLAYLSLHFRPTSEGVEKVDQASNCQKGPELSTHRERERVTWHRFVMASN